MSKAKRGRPPIPADERKTDTIIFKATPAEKAAYEQRAADANLTLSDWIRRTLNRARR